MSDQFPPAPPPPPPPPPQQPYQQGYQQPQQPQQQYGYAPPAKTGMSGGVKALLIILGIFMGLGVLGFAGLLVVGALVANEAEEIVNTAASDFESDLEEDSGFNSSFDDEEDLAAWCDTVDEFDALARASTDGFTEAELTDKILTIEELGEEVDATTPAEFEDEIDDILAPFEGVVAAFRAVDFDATQITAEDNAAFQEGLEDALPSVLVVRQACLDEGISVFEKTD